MGLYIPILEQSDAERLFKDYRFKNKYKSLVDDLLKGVDYEDFEDYKFDEYRCEGCNSIKKGVLFHYRGVWIWSWANTINTNYSCFFLMTNRVNLIIRDVLKNEIPYINFQNVDNKFTELDRLFEVLNNYKQEWFTPKNKNKKNTLFNLMRFTTMTLWYGSKLSEIYVLENIDSFLDDVLSHQLDFKRGEDDDMNNGKDFGLVTKTGVKSVQHKNDNLLKYENDYYYFNTLSYDEKNYGSVDYLSMVNKEKEIFFFENSKDRNLCGMFELPNGKNCFRIHKSLKIEQKKPLKMSLTKNLEELLKFCGTHQINFHMENQSVEFNTIEYTTNPEPNIHIVYNNLEDKSFPEKVSKILEELKEMFK